MFGEDTLIDRLVLSHIEINRKSTTGSEEVNVTTVLCLDLARSKRDTAGPFIARKESGDRVVRCIEVIEARRVGIVMVAPGIKQDKIEDIQRDLILFLGSQLPESGPYL